MRFYILFFSALMAALFSCKNKAGYTESPLSTVVKLFSAEEIKDFEEAIKYIDVDRVYADCKQENQSPMDCWKQKVDFSFNLGQTRKFTNHFKYHNYKIVESVKGKNATVKFVSLIKNEWGKIMSLELELVKDNWVVVKVNHFY